MELSVLTPVAARDWRDYLLSVQLRRGSGARFEAEQTRVSDKYQARIDARNLLARSTRELKAELAQDRNFVSTLVSRVQSLRDLVSDMRYIAFAIDHGSYNEADHARLFNSKLRQLINAAESSGNQPNLIGEQPVSSYTIDLNRAGTTLTLSHTALTTNYYIVDSNGDRWEPDRDTWQLRQRDGSTMEYTGVDAALTGEVALDSLSGSDVTFTVFPDTADATTYSGTLYEEDLGILDAWLYDSFETSNGRDRAEDDTAEAYRTVTSRLAMFESALSQIDSYSAQADLTIDGYALDAADLARSRLQELQLLEEQYSRLSTLDEQRITGTRVVMEEYTKMLNLAQTGYEDFIGALVDTQA